MNAAQQRILKYVTKNQPVTVAMIARHAGVSRSHYYAESLQLRMKGILKSVTGIGVFAGEEAYKTWLENGGRNQISENARNANAQRHHLSKKPDDDWSPVCQPYNRDSNCVVDEYMRSPFRERMMMVYGRRA
ncbi:hypothetical protein RN333_16155 [Enterobacter kobei]|uniref:hypothetical protein n=1 Tax=Enterobacter kobei TaxID=208224 RepID=UPI0028D8DE60|nr:hypothetical protein [Enterobacter kobei]WNP33611.1 hypothetical protein RN333_16155 [Enterobacter kobei]